MDGRGGGGFVLWVEMQVSGMGALDAAAAAAALSSCSKQAASFKQQQQQQQPDDNKQQHKRISKKIQIFQFDPYRI